MPKKRTRTLETLVLALLALAACRAGDETDAESSEPGPPHGKPPVHADPPLVDEAGYLDVELPSPSSEAWADVERPPLHRLFYVFQPADDHPLERPLVVFFNGGPGAASEILLGFNTAKRTVDLPPTSATRVAENPASWSRFANLLYLDAPNSGFSYVMPGDVAEQDLFGLDVYNPGIDAAECTIGLLDFLDAHPSLTKSFVVLTGESYGGLRAPTMLAELFAAVGPSPPETSAFVDRFRERVRRHFLEAFPDAPNVDEDLVASQFGAQVLIEPYLGNSCLVEKAMKMPSVLSAISDVAAELGKPFAPCRRGCAPGHNEELAAEFLLSNDRNNYDIRYSNPEFDARFEGPLSSFVNLDSLHQVLNVDPMTIPGLAASDREGAVRIAPGDDDWESSGPTADQSSLIAALGELGERDRYFIPMNMSVAHAFGNAIMSPVLTGAFLTTSVRVASFITRARYDFIVVGEAIPACLEGGPVESVDVDEDPADGARPGTMTIHFRADAFPDLSRPPSPRIRFPHYLESGHTVSMSQPLELRDDVEAWLGSIVALPRD